MKKLSIEEKAKAYDRAIERANELNYVNDKDSLQRKTIEHIFPEFAESKDEKIRKVIYGWIYTQPSQFFDSGFSKEEMLAWFEKQSEKKSISKISVSEKLYEHIRNICACIDDAMSCESIFEVKDYLGQASKDVQDAFDMIEKQGEIAYNKELSELLHKVICRFINNPDIPYSDREKVSMKVLPYVERLEKQSEQESYGQMEKCLNCQFVYTGYCNGTCILKNNKQKPSNKVEPKFKVKYAGSEYNVFEIKELAGITFYGIEDEPNHIDYVKADNCEIINGGYGIKENGSPYPIKPAKFSEQKPNYCHHEVDLSDCSEDYIKGYYDGWNNCNQQYSQLKAEQKPADITDEWIKEYWQHEKVNNPYSYNKDDEIQFDYQGFVSFCKKYCQNPVWSEEDEERIKNILSVLDVQVCWNGATGKKENPYQKEIDWLKVLKDRVQPKQEWSEEDEKIYQSIMDDTVQENQLNDKQTHWLKDIKYRYFPQLKQEWDKEDCNQIEIIACHLDNIGNGAMAESLLNIMNKYKSLRPQNTWKPSDGQMEAIICAVRNMKESACYDSELVSLLNDLKKLKE